MRLVINYSIDFPDDNIPIDTMMANLMEFAHEYGGKGQGIVKAMNPDDHDKELAMKTAADDMYEALCFLIDVNNANTEAVKEAWNQAFDAVKKARGEHE